MADESSSLPVPAPSASEEDYDAIHEAVLETARGRWFLAEFARRNRHADTRIVLAALDRLETAISPQVQQSAEPPALTTAAPALQTAKPAAQGEDEAPEIGPAQNLAQALEEATAAIRGATEHLQDVSWNLRERQYDDK